MENCTASFAPPVSSSRLHLITVFRLRVELASLTGLQRPSSVLHYCTNTYVEEDPQPSDTRYSFVSSWQNLAQT